MIAGGNDVDVEFEQLLGNLRCDAKAAGGVFTVGYGEFNTVLGLQLRQPLVHDGASGPAEDVTDEENAQAVSVLCCS